MLAWMMNLGFGGSAGIELPPAELYATLTIVPALHGQLDILPAVAATVDVGEE